MTSGYASNATDAAVQANIVAAGCECSRSLWTPFVSPAHLLLRRWEVSVPPINLACAINQCIPSPVPVAGALSLRSS